MILKDKQNKTKENKEFILRTIRFRIHDMDEIKACSKETKIPLNTLVCEGALKYAQHKREINDTANSVNW